MTALLVGYAIGTAQILILEWFRRRVQHRADLRVLRAELRRARTYDDKFDIDVPRPNAVTIPRAPNVSPRFADFVTQTQFHLTDEHDDDRAQELLLGVLDGCRLFATILDNYASGLTELAQATDPDRRASLTDNLRGMARDYDRRLAQFLSVLDRLLAEIDDRLRRASTWAQLKRPLGRLPPPKPRPPNVDNASSLPDRAA